MKALTITAPCNAMFVEQPRPSPARGEVLLRMRRVGYCGSDLNMFRGLNPLVEYPRIPGHEVGALIEERGPEVPADWVEGLEVTVSPYTNCGGCSACRQGRVNCCRNNRTLGVQRDGALCEFIAMPWQKLYRSPALSVSELALVEPLTIGFHAVDRAGANSGQTVLVLGCGAIGLGAIAAAAVRKARVLAADIEEAKFALARKCGATETIHARGSSLHDHLREWTDGEGPDIVIEAVGTPETFRSAVDEVCYAGRVVYIGYAKRPVEYETKHFILKELDIVGSRNALPADFDRVIQFLESGTFPVRDVITETVPFARADRALQAWHDNPAAFTKLHVSFE